MIGNTVEEGHLERTQSSGSDLGPVNKRVRMQKHADIADKVGTCNVSDFGRSLIRTLYLAAR